MESATNTAGRGTSAASHRAPGPLANRTTGRRGYPRDTDPDVLYVVPFADRIESARGSRSSPANRAASGGGANDTTTDRHWGAQPPGYFLEPACDPGEYLRPDRQRESGV